MVHLARVAEWRLLELWKPSADEWTDGVFVSEVISVVAPVLNEVDVLPEFYRRVTAALAGEEFELIFVNDGSGDGTGPCIESLSDADPRVRCVHLSRNFGHQAALTAGLDRARGSAVVSIDGDLQDPPEVIPDFLREWRNGADVVHGVRHVRPGEARWRMLAIRAFYATFNRISGLNEFPGNAGDFRLLSRRALDALSQLPERNRFVRGLVAWVGFTQSSVTYEREARFAGHSSYGFVQLLQLALNGIVSFSLTPLRVASGLGVIFSLVAFLSIPIVVSLRLTGLYEVPGIASVHILILFVGGVQLVFLGVLGEYLARDYDEAKRRPLYIVERES